jgi:hypothetical protein
MIKIKNVKNGYIASDGDDEYIFFTLDKLFEFLLQHYEARNSTGSDENEFGAVMIIRELVKEKPVLDVSSMLRFMRETQKLKAWVASDYKNDLEIQVVIPGVDDAKDVYPAGWLKHLMKEASIIDNL